MKHTFSLLAIAALLLQGCAVPRRVSVYDEKCDIVAKHMVLDMKMQSAVNTCVSKDCVADVIGNGMVLAASTVVSGSIVIAGNVVYWIEKKRKCSAKKTIPEPSSLVDPA